MGIHTNVDTTSEGKKKCHRFEYSGFIIGRGGSGSAIFKKMIPRGLESGSNGVVWSLCVDMVRLERWAYVRKGAAALRCAPAESGGELCDGLRAGRPSTRIPERQIGACLKQHWNGVGP